MTDRNPSSSADAWTIVAAERRRDDRLRRISLAAWLVTIGAVSFYGVVVAMRVAALFPHALAGRTTWENVLHAAVPFLPVIGGLGLLIAVMSTIGMFLRQRAASLAEIQLRLAALEDLLSRRADATVRDGTAT